MGLLSSPLVVVGCHYILVVLFISTTHSFVIESDELKNSLMDEPYGSNVPTNIERALRTTKFPRIGRSSFDLDEIYALLDANNNIDDSEDNNNENEFGWTERRSVLFPRIGKRAYHNLFLLHSLFNPQRVIDAQGRYHLNNDNDYRAFKSPPISMTNYQGK